MAVQSLEPLWPAMLRLAFDPDPASARAVSAAMRNFLAEQGVPEKELFSYELCIAEASNNAIEYAEGLSRALRPIAEVHLTQVQIELRVIDHTTGFILPERIAPPSPLTDRGRGLFLIQSVMDEVRYLRGIRENILVMRKIRRTGRANAAIREQASIDSPSLKKWQRKLEQSKAQAAKLTERAQVSLETFPHLQP